MAGRVVTLLAVGCLCLLTACSTPVAKAKPSDRLRPPELGACRNLAADDLDQASDDSTPVPCREPHTAQTFAVGTLPASTGTAYDDPGHGRHVYQRCSPAFLRFLGADESLALRIQLSWAWFRPSRAGWEKGARWYRCDVVGGADGARTLRPLEARMRGIFSRRDPEDRWLTCARGATLAGSTKVPCSRPHDWRAVTAVKVGQPGDRYPGDKIVRARSRERCSDWVGAYLNYTPDYDYGFTWFHEAEWKAGNRRSVCWTRTRQ